ncbi:glycosyltransferase [Kordiimonas aquimaris]|uniref:glycosyltransferase n=1 Tax=Kordiimonas aquimaris TaxID=707591 RepID=UPI0021D1E2D4|nr:hypothetical protein [Kordiimonas aquimaris]
MKHPVMRSFEESCIDAQLALHAAGVADADARILGFYPQVQRNPFQDMLYTAGLDQGFACFPVRSQDEVVQTFDDTPLYVHYHWVHRAFDGAEDRSEASNAAKQFLATIDAQKEAGIQTIWTVHNLISHESRFPEEEIELRAGLSARADHVHIMNPATREVCAQYYPIESKKVFMVPHPSYRGVYGDFMSRRQARFKLGISPSEKVLLLFGSMGPQKGTNQLLDELSAIEAAVGERLRVFITGAPAHAAYMEEVYERVAKNPMVTLLDSHIDDQLVPILFRAVDVAVCPYDVGLNSGVAATAATFGCPSVVPDILVPAMSGAEAGVIGFNPKDRSSIGQAVMRALEAGDNATTPSALAKWAEVNQPHVISQAFFRALRDRS